MKSAKLSSLIELSARYALTLQKSDGSFPVGHNGPYNNPETPVRNTAHWLFLFLSLYLKSGESVWKDTSEKAISYLMSSNARPYNQAFHCRDKPGKDKCNGLIGQAWVIEALIKVAETFFQDKKEANIWLERQIYKTYFSDSQCLSFRVADKNTAMARIYQAARLNEDYELRIDTNCSADKITVKTRQ